MLRRKIPQLQGLDKVKAKGKAQHRRRSVTNMMEHLVRPTLRQRRVAKNLTMSMLYKITNNLVIIPTYKYLTPWPWPPPPLPPPLHAQTIEVYILLCSTHLCCMPYQCNTNTIKYSFFPCTITTWNSLPINIATAPTIDKLKDAVLVVNLYSHSECMQHAPT